MFGGNKNNQWNHSDVREKAQLYELTVRPSYDIYVYEKKKNICSARSRILSHVDRALCLDFILYYHVALWLSHGVPYGCHMGALRVSHEFPFPFTWATHGWEI